MTNDSPTSAPGIQPKADSAALGDSVAWAQRANVAPLQAVADLAEGIANQYGSSLVGRGLRLFESVSSRPLEFELVTSDSSPYALGSLYERLLASDDRRSGGVHLTPAGVARQLVACLPASVAEPREHRVLDPAVGGGAFLLAAADALLANGQPASVVAESLAGYDLDPNAVAIAEAAIALWGLDKGVEAGPIAGLRVADGLLVDLEPATIVVGNPPFLNQLRVASTNRVERRKALHTKWPGLVGAYTDDSWLFLAAGVEALAEGGVLAMVLPISVLGAKHGVAVRDLVQRSGRLDGIWVSDGRVFDAHVEVCGVVVANDGASAPIRRWRGAGFEPQTDCTLAPIATSWGPIGVVGRGVPEVDLALGDCIEDRARVTAGFRDQFYGFAPHVVEDPDRRARDIEEPRRLVTVGMIDPLSLRWGATTFRFNKERFRSPIVRVADLEQQDPRLGEWVRARRQPKVLVATQTRVIEAWVDERGDAVPATPVISVEPTDPTDIWLLAAALSAPPVAAYCFAQKFGTAMSLDALKLAAADIARLPLPARADLWQTGANLVRKIQSLAPGSAASRAPLLADFAHTMTVAYGIEDPTLETWWIKRLPSR